MICRALFALGTGTVVGMFGFAGDLAWDWLYGAMQPLSQYGGSARAALAFGTGYAIATLVYRKP